MSKGFEAEGCTPPSLGSEERAVARDKECVLCGRKMFYAEDFQVHVCLNEDHGVLAYYGRDDCYFTSREDVGGRFLKEGRKFHMIEAEVLRMMGVKA